MSETTTPAQITAQHATPQPATPPTRRAASGTRAAASSLKPERTYGQFCPIAAGLDLVGDRWVLLICRELTLGDQRFTDLRLALPRIAPNLLSERLRSLQDAGLVVTAELPPPAARSVYRLSAEGRRVIPVLRAVARFGAAYLEGEPGAEFDARRAAASLLAPWWRAGSHTDAATSLRYRLDISAGGREVGLVLADLVTDGRRLRVVPAEIDQTADVLVSTSVDHLVAARQNGGVLVAEVAGTPAAVATFYDDFDLRPGEPGQP